jgi:hypothetical protein
MAQKGCAQQNYVPPFGGIPAPPSYYGGVPMQAWGSEVAIPPPILRNHMHIFLNHNKVVIIGGYATRNMQIITAIQTNANQMGEGNANIAYELRHLHLAPSDNS